MGEILELLWDVMTVLGIAVEIKQRIAALMTERLQGLEAGGDEEHCETDIDDMEDIYRGAPYIWNRPH